MKISIGSDHAGFDCKEYIKSHLDLPDIDITDHGTFSNDSVDYPDFVHPVCWDIEEQKSDFGIVICGSGNGTAIAANKHRTIRCALCWTEELAALARAHNDANVLSIPARFISKELAVKLVTIFLKSTFEGGRHQRRVDKIIPS
jgi:ribose 5-phosphate isomerase B